MYPIKNYLTSLPVKVFEYMAKAKPIIMSDFPYWRKYFEKCARFADPYNPGTIAKEIDFLISNPETANKLGQAGFELIQQNYSWNKEKSKLLKIYEKLK